MRYRLRTLLIVLTAIGAAFGWIGWQYRIVAHRKAVARMLEARGDTVIWEGVGWGENVERWVEGDKSRNVSTLRRWLGDENADSIFIHGAEQNTRAAIEAFPEADFYLPP